MHYPSLFVVVNSDQARWFEIEESSVQEMSGLRAPLDQYTDNEGTFSGMGQGVGGGPEVMNNVKRENENHHFKQVAHHTTELVKKQSYKHICVAIPEHSKNAIAAALHQGEMSQTPLKMVYGDHIHATKESVKDLFLQSLQPQE